MWYKFREYVSIQVMFDSGSHNKNAKRLEKHQFVLLLKKGRWEKT